MMGLCRLIVKKVCPLPRIEDFNRYLFIGPHPDDIEIGAGATVSKLTSERKSVCFLICTDGRYGYENLKDKITPDELVLVRQKEAVKSAAMLGVTDVRFLGLSDGGFYSAEELADGIMSTIADYNPDVVFAPDPCVKSECHTDHLNVGEAARRTALFSRHDEIMKRHGAQHSADLKAVAFYMTSDFNTYVKTAGHLKNQLEAIFTCHLSQFPEGCADRKSISAYLTLRSKINGVRNCWSDAEGFRVLGSAHMHCLPDISK